MNRIRQMIEDFVRDTGGAEITEQDGRPGVLFYDEDQFIPFANLGYNHIYGFYELDRLPDVKNEAVSDE